MENVKHGYVIELIKGMLIGVSICLAGVLLFAFVLKFVTLTTFWVRTINQIIKLCAVTVACLLSVKGERGFLKGAGVGLAVITVTYLLFGIVSGGLSFGWKVVLEAFYGLLIGILGGILAVNLKKQV